MKQLSENATDYISHKGHYTVNIQAVTIINIVLQIS